MGDDPEFRCRSSHPDPVSVSGLTCGASNRGTETWRMVSLPVRTRLPASFAAW